MSARGSFRTRVARWTFGLAAAYGFIVLAPAFFMADVIERNTVPISHPEYFYGFFGTAIAWQFVFAVIAREPLRYRLMMLPSILEKAAFSLPALWLATQGRLQPMTLPFAIIDLLLGIAFTVCFWLTRDTASPSDG